uniref:Uncharacterized protein n=1 Tax=Fagus sylvatica TaxID=28930 RepID=A0A2N9HVH6_FAGSY
MATMAKNESSSSSSVCTTHHRRHHQQWWRILALSPLLFFFLRLLASSLSAISLLLSHEEGTHGLNKSLLPHGLILTLTEVLDLAKAPSPELELPHGLILTLTEVLDLAKAPSPELDSHHGHGQELSSSHPLILMAPNLTGLMMAPL